MERELFGRWLDRTLENEGITGRQVADALNVTDSAVSRWRNGQVAPDLDKLPILADFLKVDLLRLMATAGIPGMVEQGAPPYPVPQEDGKREKIIREIRKIRGLSTDQQQELVRTYEKTIHRGAASSERTDSEHR